MVNPGKNILLKDMPYSAIMPIFTKYKNDVILTKLLLLEELANKK